MTVSSTLCNEKMTVSLSGRLDTMTAPQLEAELARLPQTVTELVLDFSGVVYISSAGLRVLLAAQKRMNACRGCMKLCGANRDILEVFEITGFSDILTIEPGSDQ